MSSAPNKEEKEIKEEKVNELQMLHGKLDKLSDV